MEEQLHFDFYEERQQEEEHLRNMAYNSLKGLAHMYGEEKAVDYMEQVIKETVYPLGDGSCLCERHLKKYLDDTDQPNNITCGKDVDCDGLPLYGWIEGQCSDC